MKTVSWYLSIGYPTANRTGEFEVEDGTPEAEIEKMVRDEAYNFIEWSWTAEEDDDSTTDDVSTVQATERNDG